MGTSVEIDFNTLPSNNDDDINNDELDGNSDYVVDKQRLLPQPTSIQPISDNEDFVMDEPTNTASSCYSRGSFDVIFLLDTTSNTTNNNELNILKEWMLNLIISLGYWDDENNMATPSPSLKQPPKSDGRLGIIQFATNSTAVYPFSYPTSKMDVFEAIYDMKLKDNSRRLGSALNHSTGLFNDQQLQNITNKEDDNRKILVIVSTGNSDDDVKDAAEKLKESDVEIIYIGLKEATLKMATEISSKPFKKHVFLVNQFELLDDIKKKVKWKLCKRAKDKKGKSPLVSYFQNHGSHGLVFDAIHKS